MKKFIAFMAVLISFSFVLPTMGITSAFAVNEDEYELRLELDQENSLYKYSFGRTEYYFLSNVRDGEQTADTVRIYLPNAAYTLYTSDGIRVKEGKETEDSMVMYEFSSYMEYSFKIASPTDANDSRAYVLFGCTMAEYPYGEKTITMGENITVKTNALTENVEPGVYFKFDYALNVMYNYKQDSYSYTSGEKLTKEGEYSFTFTSDDDPNFWYTYSLTIATETEQEPTQATATQPTSQTTQNTLPEQTDVVEMITEKTVALNQVQENGLYKQYITDDIYFYTNVPNGGEAEEIIVSYGDNVEVTAYSGKRQINYRTQAAITDEGSYTFYVSIITQNADGKNERLIGEFKASVKSLEQEQEQEQIQEVEPEETTANLQAVMDELYQSYVDGQIGEVTIEDLQNVTQNIGSNAAVSNIISKLSKESDLSSDDINRLITRLVETKVTSNEDVTASQEYNKDNGYYVNKFSPSDYITVTVPNGAITNNDVTVDIIGENLEVKAYKDDVPYTLVPNVAITEHGNYRIEAKYYDGTTRIVYFYIIKHAVNDLLVFNAPAGFMISNLVKGNKSTRAWMSYYKITSDDKYEFLIESLQDSQIVYSVKVTLDTTSPKFTILGMTKQNTAKKPTEIIDKGKDILYYEIYRDGQPYELSGTKLTQSGWYNITAYDAAQNSSVINVKVHYQMSGGSITALVVFSIIIGSGIIWFVISKKNMGIS